MLGAHTHMSGSLQKFDEFLTKIILHSFFETRCRFASTSDYLKICKFITYWSLEAVNIKKSLIITGVTN